MDKEWEEKHTLPWSPARSPARLTSMQGNPAASSSVSCFSPVACQYTIWCLVSGYRGRISYTFGREVKAQTSWHNRVPGNSFLSTCTFASTYLVSASIQRVMHDHDAQLQADHYNICGLDRLAILRSDQSEKRCA